MTVPDCAVFLTVPAAVEIHSLKDLNSTLAAHQRLEHHVSLDNIVLGSEGVAWCGETFGPDALTEVRDARGSVTHFLLDLDARWTFAGYQAYFASAEDALLFKIRCHE